MKETYFVALLQGELGVLAIDTLCVDGTARLLHFCKDFQQVLSIDFTRTNQCQQESLMGRMHLLKLQLKKQTLCARKGFASIYLLLDEHKFAKNVIDDPQMRVWIVLVWLHYLSTCVAHSCWLVELPVKRLTCDTRSN